MVADKLSPDVLKEIAYPLKGKHLKEIQSKGRLEGFKDSTTRRKVWPLLLWIDVRRKKTKVDASPSTQ